MASSLQVASEAVRTAGKEVLNSLSGLKVEDIAEKAPNDYVTRVDKASEETIRKIILKAYPKDSILGEETGGAIPRTEFLWIADPLDGTHNYIHGFPFFCVSLALAVNGRPEIGAIYDPLRDELFLCKRDEGIWLNNNPISTSSCSKIEKALIGTGFPAKFKKESDEYVAQLARVFRGSASLRRAGAAALDLAYVSCGRLDAFWEPRLSVWDMAAGGLMIEAAGGMIGNEVGDEWTLDSKGIICGNADIYPQLVKMVKG
jgi:myo-inositol-1(or 4)-monophosphatase